jgi:hypothetical protein
MGGARGWLVVTIGVALLAALVLAGAADASDVDAVEGATFAGTILRVDLDALCPVQGGTTPNVQVVWGDGPGSTSNGVATRSGSQWVFSGSHTYRAFGSYSGTLNVTWTCNATGMQHAFPFTVAVADAPLTASAAPFGAAAGTAFSGVVARLGDANPNGTAADDHATIDWGDGSAAVAGTVSAQADGKFAVSGSHTYMYGGSYGVRVTVGDSGSSTSTATSTATVSGPPAPGTGTTPAPVPPGSSPAPAPAPAPLVARFAVSASAPGSVTLDASATSGPGRASYEWSLPGGAADVVCPGGEPRLTLSAPGAFSGTIGLIATAGAADGGGTSSTRQPIAIRAPAGVRRAGVRAHVAATLTAGRTVGVCSGSGPAIALPKLQGTPLARAALGGVSRADGAPPAACTDDLVFGAADLHGCLSQIPDPNDLPGGISFLLAGLLCGAHDDDFCTGPLTSAVSSAASSLLASAAAVTPPRATIGHVESVVGAMGLPSYFTYNSMRLDGLDIVPQGGYPILILPSAHAVAAVKVKIFLGGKQITPVAIPLTLYLPATGFHLGDLTLPKSLPVIGSLPFTGSIGIDLLAAHHVGPNGTVCPFACAALSVQAELPGVLADEDGNGLSASGVITADSEQGVQLDSLEVKVPNAELAGVGVKDLDVRYRREDDSLHAGATFDLFGAAGEVTGSIDFLHGRFSGASILWDAGDGPGIDLGGPLNLYLMSLGGSIALDPQTRLTATGSLTGGPQVLGCALVGVSGSMTMAFDPTSFDADADGTFICQHTSHVYFHVDDSGSILVGGDVDLHLLFLEIRGGIALAGDVAHGHFQADANMSVCLDLFGTHCLGAEVVVSDRGIGACADLGFTHAGGGVQFPDHVLTFLDTCDIGKFRSLGFTTQSGGGASRGVTIPAGERVAALAFAGTAAGAPRVTLTGPDGRVIATPADGYLKDAHAFVAADDAQTHKTYVLIDHPAAGLWRVAAQPGSVPVTGLEQAAGLPKPDVRARVSHAREITYTLHRLAGQVVTLVERDAKGATRRVAVLHGTHGTLRFTPDPGLAVGTRKLVAEVDQDGRPREDDVVATFHAAAPTPLRAPRGLRATRHGTRAAVSWHRVTGAAAGYAVSLTQPHGTKMYVSSHGTTASFTDLRSDEPVTVTIRALRTGRPAHIGHPASKTIAGHRSSTRHVVSPLRLAA